MLERTEYCRHSLEMNVTNQSETEMSEVWRYQVRLRTNDDIAALIRANENTPILAPLMELLAQHKATIKSQYDAFADYVAAADAGDAKDYPLAEWTRATIEDPVKKAKYIKAFTIYIGGEVYEKDLADALVADLEPLVLDGLIEQVTKHDTNPANNPQMPERFRQS